MSSTFTTFLAKSADDNLVIIFLFFKHTQKKKNKKKKKKKNNKKQQTTGFDILWGKEEKYFNMSSAENFTQSDKR